MLVFNARIRFLSESECWISLEYSFRAVSFPFNTLKILCHLIIESLCLGRCAFDLGVIKRSLHLANTTNPIEKGSRCRLRTLLHAVLLLPFALQISEIVNLSNTKLSKLGTDSALTSRSAALPLAMLIATAQGYY